MVATIANTDFAFFSFFLYSLSPGFSKLVWINNNRKLYQEASKNHSQNNPLKSRGENEIEQRTQCQQLSVPFSSVRTQVAWGINMMIKKKLLAFDKLDTWILCDKSFKLNKFLNTN